MTVDGNDCLFATEGAAADLPLDQDPYTISAWIKPDSSSSSGGIVGWGSRSTDGVLAFRLRGLTQLHLYWWANDLTTPPSTKNLADGEWHFVATTWAPSAGRRIYVDDPDTPVATDSATRPSGSFTQKSEFCVGKTLGTDLGFSGGIRDLRIFKAVVNITQLVDP